MRLLWSIASSRTSRTLCRHDLVGEIPYTNIFQTFNAWCMQVFLPKTNFSSHPVVKWKPYPHSCDATLKNNPQTNTVTPFKSAVIESWLLVCFHSWSPTTCLEFSSLWDHPNKVHRNLTNYRGHFTCHGQQHSSGDELVCVQRRTHCSSQQQQPRWEGQWETSAMPTGRKESTAPPNGTEADTLYPIQIVSSACQTFLRSGKTPNSLTTFERAEHCNILSRHHFDGPRQVGDQYTLWYGPFLVHRFNYPVTLFQVVV